MAHTMVLRPNNDTLRLTSKEESQARHKISVDASSRITGRLGVYRFLRAVPIGRGGQSEVYLVIGTDNKGMFAAKIYYECNYTATQKKNRKDVIDVQQKIERLNRIKRSYALVPVDYGIYDNWGEDGKSYPLEVDILPLVKQGSLDKKGRIDYRTLKNKVIPQIATALSVLHSCGFIHRDVKPGNIYELNGEYVLGDFGFACRSAQMQNTAQEKGIYHDVDDAQMGTLGYIAPEVYRGRSLPASDFYALGCTIATLFNGKHIYQDIIDMGRTGEVIELMEKHGLPLECSEEERSLGRLISALMVAEAARRIGAEDIGLWCKDYNAFEDKHRALLLESEGGATMTFRIGGKSLYGIQELCNWLADNWTEGRNLFYNGEIIKCFSTRGTLFQPLVISATALIDERNKRKTHADMGYARFLHYLGQGQGITPIYWRGKTYIDISQIAVQMSLDTTIITDIKDLLRYKLLSWMVANTPALKDNERLLKLLDHIEETFDKHPNLSYYYAKYALHSENNVARLFGQYSSPDEYFAAIATSPRCFYAACEKMLRDDEVYGWLIYWGNESAVLALKKMLSFSKSFLEDVYRLFVLFESVCNDKGMVRACFNHFGPKTYVLWLKYHLMEYSGSSQNALEVMQRIYSICVRAEDSVENQNRQFDAYMADYVSFTEQTQSNPYLAYLRLRGAAHILPITSDALLVEWISSETVLVPNGFIRYIGFRKTAELRNAL